MPVLRNSHQEQQLWSGAALSLGDKLCVLQRQSQGSDQALRRGPEDHPVVKLCYLYDTVSTFMLPCFLP
ncbi:hypothetical protein STEG23_032709 [Scotinomys teguina]